MSMPQTISAYPAKRLLPVEIHTATQTQHTSLNRLITSRLPLCLPPHAPDAAAYLGGIEIFGQIYFAFERAWDEQIETLQPEYPLRSLLKQLHLSSLSRTGRLQDDLDVLRSRLTNAALLEMPSTEGDSAWEERIKISIQMRPHVVLAYAWVMYMALFNGGRWIRDQITSAGGLFWGQLLNEAAVSEHPTESIQGLSFWEFEGDEDGNDIKDAFKARFNSVSEQLGDAERHDIIEEAVAIFVMCSDMILWLDAHPPRQTSLEKTQVDNSWISVTLATAFSAAYSMWEGLNQLASSIGLKKPNLSSLVNEGPHASS